MMTAVETQGARTVAKDHSLIREQRHCAKRSGKLEVVNVRRQPHARSIHIDATAIREVGIVKHAFGYEDIAELE